MQIVFDPETCAENVRRHGFDLADAELVFAGITYTMEDTRAEHAYPRFVTLGLLAEVVIVISHTESRNEVRVLSMRKATRNEQALFFENI